MIHSIHSPLPLLSCLFLFRFLNPTQSLDLAFCFIISCPTPYPTSTNQSTAIHSCSLKVFLNYAYVACWSGIFRRYHYHSFSFPPRPVLLFWLFGCTHVFLSRNKLSHFAASFCMGQGYVLSSHLHRVSTHSLIASDFVSDAAIISSSHLTQHLIRPHSQFHRVTHSQTFSSQSRPIHATTSSLLSRLSFVLCKA